MISILQAEKRNRRHSDDSDDQLIEQISSNYLSSDAHRINVF